MRLSPPKLLHETAGLRECGSCGLSLAQGTSETQQAKAHYLLERCPAQRAPAHLKESVALKPQDPRGCTSHPGPPDVGEGRPGREGA